MADLSNGLKCKYCQHYSGYSCKFYNNPSKICLHFYPGDDEIVLFGSISEMQRSGTPFIRDDGSYIVFLNDVPSVKAELVAAKNERNEKELTGMCGCAFLGLIGMLFFLWPFIEMFADILFWIF